MSIMSNNKNMQIYFAEIALEICRCHIILSNLTYSNNFETYTHTHQFCNISKLLYLL